MSQEAMLAAINAELSKADAATMSLVLDALRNAKQAQSQRTFRANDLFKALPPRMQTASEFVGENQPFDPKRSLSLHGRATIKRQIKAQNREWLSGQFQKLKAAWIMIIDGQVVASGVSLATYPKPEQILEACHRTGKFPLLFIDEDHLAIEEGGSRWHRTNIPGDYYPSVPLTLRSNNSSTLVLGDFDTGASSTFVDYEWLVKQKLVHLQIQEDAESSHHLNQTYAYLPRSFVVEIASKPGGAQALEITIACVIDWKNSPFVKVNPDRVALVGRDVLLALRPKVLLDFDARRTEIQTKKAAKQARAQSKKTTRRAAASSKRQ